MSQLFVDNIKNRTGGAIGAPSGIVVTGVSTLSGNVSIGGTLTYEDLGKNTSLLTTKDIIDLNKAIVANEDKELKSALVSLSVLVLVLVLAQVLALVLVLVLEVSKLVLLPVLISV